MATVQFKHVTKKFDGNEVAVRDFSIDIADKEFIILVGPSGCGKSTTLRMLAGLEDVSEGEIFIDGKQVNNLPPRDRDIAMVFQNYALYPHMTVFDNMAFGLKRRKFPKDEIRQRVLETAQKLEIDHLLHRKPRALSGGQRQRVALGRAIVRSPKVFLMDEPLSNLDAKLRIQMRVEITKLHQRLQNTMIYVTHDQTEAMTMGNRIVVMKEGVIQQIDNPENLYRSPVNTFVAGFIGMPPMNLFDAALTVEQGQVNLHFHGCTIALPERYATQTILACDGQDVIMGVRPEAISDDAQFVQTHQSTAFAADIDVVETMGAETYLYATVGDQLNVIARVDPAVSRSRTGEATILALDGNQVHLFDKKTQRSLLIEEIEEDAAEEPKPTLQTPADAGEIPQPIQQTTEDVGETMQ